MDNDKAGKDTVKKIQYHLKNQYKIIDCSPQKYKDVNQELQTRVFHTDMER